MKIYKIILLFTFVALLSVLGCSDRGVNTGKDSYLLSEGSFLTKMGTHVFHNELTFQINNPEQQMPLVGYWPRVALPIVEGGEFKPVPMLILLPPQDGDEYFYFTHGLKEIADEMISRGEIQPMAILCISNDKIFGGYFYSGSSPAAGYYDSLIGTELIRFAEEDFFVTTIRTKAKRAIGGIGMGAYGAYRAAMLHPDAFGAVSGFAGPMDFDGADNASGFMDLFDDALAEQGITGQNLKNTYLHQDKNLWGSWYLSRLFVGASFAFSAYDTAFNYVDTALTNSLGVQRVEYSLVSAETLDTAIFPGVNAITIPGISVPPNAFQNIEYTYKFHLPFDNTGQPVTAVWNRWLENNLPNLYTTHPNAFAGMYLWLGNSSESTFGNYAAQTDSWGAYLTTQGVPFDSYSIKGYEGNPANKDQYVADILREMLIFHSDNFGN